MSARCLAAADGTAALLCAGAAVDDSLPGVACAALPPHTPSAAGGDVLRGEGAVFRGVPFFGHCRVEGSEVVEPCQHFFIGTVGAAAAALGAAGDDGLVVVAPLAAPPNLFVAGWGDVFRRKGAVFGGVPLARDVRVLTCKVVVTWNNDFASTDGAAAAVDAAGNAGLVVVAFGAVPPDFAPGAGDDVGRGEDAVFRWVPLRGKVWIKTCEIVVPSLNLLISANGTTSTIDTGFHLCPPLVTLLTAPPSQAMAAGQHLVRSEIAVFRRVPFLRQIRIAGGEIGFTGNGQTPAAIGTSSAAACAGVHGSLPAVPIGAAPPNTLFAAIADRIRGERSVSCIIPLFQQFFPLLAAAIF